MAQLGLDPDLWGAAELLVGMRRVPGTASVSKYPLEPGAPSPRAELPTLSIAVSLPCPCLGTTHGHCPVFGGCMGVSHQQFCIQTMCNHNLLLAVLLANHQHVMAILGPQSMLGQVPAALQETQLLETPSQFLMQWVRPCETTTNPLSNSSCPAGVGLGMLVVLHGCHQEATVDKCICYRQGLLFEMGTVLGIKGVGASWAT